MASFAKVMATTKLNSSVWFSDSLKNRRLGLSSGNDIAFMCEGKKNISVFWKEDRKNNFFLHIQS